MVGLHLVPCMSPRLPACMPRSLIARYVANERDVWHQSHTQREAAVCIARYASPSLLFQPGASSYKKCSIVTLLAFLYILVKPHRFLAAFSSLISLVCSFLMLELHLL